MGTDIGEYISTVDNRVVANYMMWRYVESLMRYQDKEARQIFFEYKKVITGTETEPPRWSTCVESTSGIYELHDFEGSLNNAIGSMYAK